MNANKTVSDFSQDTMNRCGTDALTLRRVVMCRKAMMRAQNHKFREFWAKTAMSLIQSHG